MVKSTLVRLHNAAKKIMSYDSCAVELRGWQLCANGFLIIWGEPERAPPSAPQRCVVCHIIIIYATDRHPTMRMCGVYVEVQGSVNPSCVVRIGIREVGRRECARDHGASESAAQRKMRLAS